MIDLLACDSPRANQRVQRLFGVQSSHHHDPIHGRPVTTQLKSAAGAADQRYHAQIRMRRQTAIQLHFGFASLLAPLNGAVVQEIETDRLFQFVDPAFGEKQPRDMRFQAFDGARLFSVRAAAAEQLDRRPSIGTGVGRQSGAILDDHRPIASTCGSGNPGRAR